MKQAYKIWHILAQNSGASAKISKIQFEFSGRQGLLEAFFALCSQYFLRSVELVWIFAS